jgi:ribonuclease BN (tRNA processing enzyme)
MAMHLNGRQAGETAARAGAQRLLVTHLAPGTDANDTLAHARAGFGGPVELAAEGLAVEI